MARTKTIHTCTECGGQSPKWQGQCPHCNAWNTLVETALEMSVVKGTNRFASLGGSSGGGGLAPGGGGGFPRLPALIGGFDRGLGGGLVGGGGGLLRGDPG